MRSHEITCRPVIGSSTRRRVGPVLVAFAAVISTATTGGGASAATVAHAHTVQGVHLNSYEAKLLADMNRARHHHGLAPLTIAPGATDTARRWSWHLARIQTLVHDPDLTTRLAHSGSRAWQDIEENIGYAPIDSPKALFQAYMKSAGHRANILSSQVAYVGIGVVQRGGTAWNTVDFVNDYSDSYGPTRVPANGLSTDTTKIRHTTRIASAYHHDQRFGINHSSSVSATAVHFSGPDAHARFHAHSAHGHGAMVFCKSLQLRHVTALHVDLGATTASGQTVPVTIEIGNGWTSTRLATVPAGATRTVRVKVPHADRHRINTVELTVSAHHMREVGHRVTLYVSDLTADVG